LTAPTPEPAPGSTGTAVAPVDDKAVEKAASKFDKFIGTLPPGLRAHLKVQELIGQAHAAVLSQTAWGNKATPEVRAAVGRYLAKHNLDPSHIDVLGGNLYRNHRFYLDQLAPLQQAGKVVYAIYDHIEVDLRLDALMASTDADTAKWAKDERSRRQKERIIHAIPEDAISACVFRLKLRTDDGGETQEITGAKPVFNNSAKDPVGTSNPHTTSESRAARRCLRNAIASLPPAQRQRMELMDADFEVLETTVAGKITDDREPDPTKPKQIDIGMGDGAKFRPAGHSHLPVKTVADPYADGPAAGAVPASDPNPSQEPSALDKARALVIPGEPAKWDGHGGKTFGEAPIAVLRAIYKWAAGKIDQAGSDGDEASDDLITWKHGAVLVLREVHKIEDPEGDLPF
jgi:hypothetical protein